MNLVKYILTIVLTTALATALAQQPFTAGNLVVYRIGDGSAALGSTADKIFLDEYTPGGVLVQSILMPTTGKKLTMAGGLTDAGYLTLSANGKYLVVPGWDLNVGDPLATITGNNRSVGLVDVNGEVNVNVITNNPAIVPINAAASSDGSDIWFLGGTEVEHIVNGTETSNSVASLSSSSFGMNIWDGQLYASTNINASPLVQIGSSLPVGTGQIFASLPGIPIRTRPRQFAFADLDTSVPGPDVLYMASQNPLAAGGIQKYSLVGGTWVLNGRVGTTAEGYAGLTISVSGNTVTVFATRQGSNSSGVRGGELVKLVDNTGYNATLTGTVTVLATVTAPDTRAFRGVALVPQPAPFTAGNLAVYRVGDGTTVLDSKAAKVYVDEYTTGGTLVQSILMPSTGKKLTNFGTDQFGFLSLSADGKYLLVPGYDIDPGSVTQSDQSIGIIDSKASLTVDVLTNPNLDLMRSVASDNGSDLWFANGNTGVNYTTHGSTTASPVGALSSSNAVLIVDGQLYASSNGNTTSVVSIGQGLPTASGQTVTPFPGIPIRTRAQQFALVDMEPTVPGVDVLYLASLNPLNPGGIQKYSLVNGTWVFNGQVGATADRYSGLTIKQTANTITIFATRKGNNSVGVAGGELVSLIDDSGYNGTLTGTPSVIASVTNPDTKAFRGLARVPLSCPSVSNLRTAGVAASQANITWTPAGTASGNYEYAFNTTGVPPASGTATSSTSALLTGLTDATTYYAFVRTVCTASSASEWNTISFVTGCKPPAAPAVTVNIAANGIVSIKWDAVFGAASYEYFVSTSAAPPFAGTTTNDTTFTVSNLDAVTSYYVHVRSNCGGGVFSEWTTKAFTTNCFMPVTDSKIMAGGAGVSWNRITNAVKYEYALTATPAHPLSGAVTTDSFYLSRKLMDGSGNYFHVRSICSNGSVSEWNTIQLNVPGVNVYPNPFKDKLTIQINGMGANATIAIADASGRVVAQLLPAGNNITVDTRAWSAGIYLVRYRDEQHQYMVRVLKQ